MEIVFQNVRISDQPIEQIPLYLMTLFSIAGPVPLRCYANNQSYYGFLQSSFLGFQLPNLTTFLSIIPQNKRNQVRVQK